METASRCKPSCSDGAANHRHWSARPLAARMLDDVADVSDSDVSLCSMGLNSDQYIFEVYWSESIMLVIIQAPAIPRGSTCGLWKHWVTRLYAQLKQ